MNKGFFQTFNIKIAIILLGFLFLLVRNKKANGQEFLSDSMSFSDSLFEDAWSEETLYSIELLRLQRWLREEAREIDDATFLKEIVFLKEESEKLATEGNFTLAVLWIETIWDLINSTFESITVEEEVTDSLEELGNDIYLNSPAKFKWSRELVTGVDLWRQEFEFTFATDDSTFLEGDGNPYGGIRLNFEYGSDYQNSIQGYTFFKYSRDYISGEGNFRLTKPLTRNSIWKLENRSEGTWYIRDDTLKYFQNTGRFAIDIRRLGPFSLGFEDEIILRRYAHEDGIYPNYFNNTFRTFARLAIGINSFMSVGYRNIQRLHPNFNEDDYQENRVDVTFYRSLGKISSLSLENQLKFRDYKNVPRNPFFQFDYWEDYFRGKVRLPLNSTFGTEFQGSLNKRNYKLRSATTPDYIFWEIEPAVYFNIKSKWKISFGFYYGRQIYDQSMNPLATDALTAAHNISFENYKTYGPTFAIELFQIDGIILDLRHSFLMERYPNAPTRDIQRFNLYSDRNINSILLFLTWNLSKQWQLGVLANIDDDHSLKDDNGDNQSTIVSFEMSYSF